MAPLVATSAGALLEMSFDGFEQALAVDHGKDFDPRLVQLVDETVAIEKTLAYGRILQLRHDTSDLGLLDNGIGQREEFFDYALRVKRRIAADVGGDRVGVIQRLLRPDYR